jgi:uncharacterized protein YifE (UPF0438 family)
LRKIRVIAKAIRVQAARVTPVRVGAHTTAPEAPHIAAQAVRVTPGLVALATLDLGVHRTRGPVAPCIAAREARHMMVRVALLIQGPEVLATRAQAGLAIQGPVALVAVVRLFADRPGSVPVDMSERNHEFDHLRFRRIPFRVECDTTLFSSDELERLQKYGSWMTALMRSAIPPRSPAQEDFVQCFSGKKKPETQFEVLWMKYCLQVIFERALKMEKTLVDGRREYAEVRKEFAWLAWMGHAGARKWMEQEGPWVHFRSAPAPDFSAGLVSHAYDRDSTNTLMWRAHGSFGSRYEPGQGPVAEPNPVDDAGT